MRPKWIIILVLLLSMVLFVALYLKNKLNKQVNIDSTSETELKTQSKNNPSSSKQTKNEETVGSSKPLDLSAKDEINGIPISEYLAEIKDPVYSDDPVLEVTSLGVDFMVCDHSLRMLTEKAEQRPELITVKDQLKAKCENYAEQYPLLFETRNQHENALNLPANSLLGEQFKYILAGFYGIHNDLTYDQLLSSQFELSLELENPGLISLSASSVAIGLTAPSEQAAFFMDLLQSKVNIWVFEAHNLALQLLTCDLPNSQSCDATSFYMTYWCQNEPASCGLTLQQWYEEYTTPGMKKDVEIIQSYYRERYW